MIDLPTAIDILRRELASAQHPREPVELSQTEAIGLLELLKSFSLPKELEHGTLKAYRAGCRCDLCREANALHSANWRAKKE